MLSRFEAYPRHISGKSPAYIWHISGISYVDLSKSQPKPRQISRISWAYHRHITDIWCCMNEAWLEWDLERKVVVIYITWLFCYFWASQKNVNRHIVRYKITLVTAEQLHLQLQNNYICYCRIITFVTEEQLHCAENISTYNISTISL